MPYCIAVDCQSHYRRRRCNNISFHSFPKKTVNNARVWYSLVGKWTPRVPPGQSNETYFLDSYNGKFPDVSSLGIRVECTMLSTVGHCCSASNGPDASYDDICQLYGNYVQSRYQTATIIFDSYTSGLSTKDEAHQRRSGGEMGVNVQFKRDCSA